MKQLLFLLVSFLSISNSSAQTKISDIERTLGFDYLQNTVTISHVTEIEGTNYLLIRTFDNILKFNMDDSDAEVEIIEYRSGCFSRPTFQNKNIIFASDSDVYDYSLESGKYIFHLSLSQENINGAVKVGAHYYIHGLGFDALYQTDLEELITLPHEYDYNVVGNQLIGLKDGGVYLEYGDLFHVNLEDGSIIVDFDLVNIRNHTLYNSEDGDKLFFSTVEGKLYSMNYANYDVTLLCENFYGQYEELIYKEGELFTIELFGLDLKADQFDFDNCMFGKKIGAYEIGPFEFFKDVHVLSDGVTYVIETTISALIYDSSSGNLESSRLNFGELYAFFVQGDNFFVISSIGAAGEMLIQVYLDNGDMDSQYIKSGVGLFSFNTFNGFGLIFTDKNDLFKLTFDSDNNPKVRILGNNGINEGPYEDSDWRYRNGYFYSTIDNEFHYLNDDGQIRSLPNLKMDGSPWVNEDGQFIGVSTNEMGQYMWIYDLESGDTDNAKPIDISGDIHGVFQVKGNYYIAATDGIYTLDIDNGDVVKILEDNFIPYLNSNERSVGNLEIADNYRKFVSFNGVELIEIFSSSSPNLKIEPISQVDGSYMIYGLSELTSFNEFTDELVTTEQEGFYYLTSELRYNGENCFIDINNNWVYYYSSDTLVLKPLLIEGEHQIVWGYVANNTIFTSSSPNSSWVGVPFAQTADDMVIELESSIGNVSIADAMYVNETYFLLSFDNDKVYLHSISEDFTQVETLATFDRPICRTHGSFYFLGPDYQGDINFRISTTDRGTVYYQYEFDEQDVSLLFDPSSLSGNDIGDLKFYNDKGVYLTAADGGYNFQMWTISNDSDPNSIEEVTQEKPENLIYPNPFHDKILFKKPVNNVSIYNTVGKKVFQLNSKTTLNYIDGLNQLAKGVYFIEYQSGKEKSVEKIVKM